MGLSRSWRSASALRVSMLSAAWMLTSFSVAADKQVKPAMGHAFGTFDVKLTPQVAEEKAEGSTLGRSSIEKQYKGGLDGIATGEMLTALSDVKGSGAYVAIERVTGTLHGRSGSFVLQHSGTMTRGAPNLVIIVVPDSGTGQLAGLTGKLAIKIAGGMHSYDFEYSLP